MGIDDRSITLLGAEAFDRLATKRVAVFGLGGVGGTCFEGLIRSGIRHLTIVDFDAVSLSNLNRQILFLAGDVGANKAEIAKKRALSIAPEAAVETIVEKIDESFFARHDFSNFDYLIDAIDDVKGKLAIAEFAREKKIPLISSLGMANRLDPSQVKVTTLDLTSGDPLARKIRQIYRAAGLDLSQIEVVFSTEEPLVKNATPSSMMMVPSEAGLLIDSVVIKRLSKK